MKYQMQYSSAFVERGIEREVIRGYELFGYTLKNAQYVQIDPEPWQRKIEAYDRTEINDAVAGNPVYPKNKPQPFPGYVTLFFEREIGGEQYPYYKNVYHLYQRVQFDVFSMKERREEHKRKLNLPLPFCFLYLALLLLGIAGIVFSIVRGYIPDVGQLGEVINYSLGHMTGVGRRYLLIGMSAICIYAGAGLFVGHYLLRLIYHSIRAISANMTMKELIREMRDPILDSVAKKQYPSIDFEYLREIENKKGIYSGTVYNKERRRKDDFSLRQIKRIKDEQDTYIAAKEADKKKKEAIKKAQEEKKRKEALAKKEAKKRRRPVKVSSNAIGPNGVMNGGKPANPSAPQSPAPEAKPVEKAIEPKPVEEAADRDIVEKKLDEALPENKPVEEAPKAS